jgi:hypothetical protein
MCDLLAKAVGRWVLLSDKSKRLIILWIRDTAIATEGSEHAQSRIDEVVISLFAAQGNKRININNAQYTIMLTCHDHYLQNRKTMP